MSIRDPAATFAGASRPAAVGVLLMVAALMALGLFQPAGPARVAATGQQSDEGFYSKVVARVRAGEPYDQVAIAEQRASDYPVRPFIAVRPPLLATALAWLPDPRLGDVLLTSLAAIVIAAWAFRLRTLRDSVWWLAGTPLIVFTGVEASMPLAGMSLLHETWAGLLIALSLAARSDKRFAAAVVIGLMAALIRELAMPYLAVMALVALFERRKVEAMAFAAALAIALAALAAHAHAVMAIVTDHDPSSPSWLALGGWGFVLSTARWNFIALRAGAWAANVIVPLALVGAVGRKDGLGRRLAVLLVGYTAGFMVVGRPDNYYWGLVTAPLLAVGLCFTPLALADLVRQTIRPPAPNP